MKGILVFGLLASSIANAGIYDYTVGRRFKCGSSIVEIAADGRSATINGQPVRDFSWGNGQFVVSAYLNGQELILEGDGLYLEDTPCKRLKN